MVKKHETYMMKLFFLQCNIFYVSISEIFPFLSICFICLQHTALKNDAGSWYRLISEVIPCMIFTKKNDIGCRT